MIMYEYVNFYFWANYPFFLTVYIILQPSRSSNSRAFTLARPRPWVRFPGKARTDKNVNVYLERQCKSLWIKAQMHTFINAS